MFRTALSTAIVEALRAAFDEDFEAMASPDKIRPKRIDIEYAVEQQDWPFILVKPHIADVSWSGGIVPDEVWKEANPDDPDKPWRSIRRGFFSGDIALEVLTTAAHERDRLWDTVVKMLLFGRKKEATNAFFETLDNHDLIGITVGEGDPTPVGDTTGVGTPWSDEEITYEAELKFAIVGEFWADEFNEELIPLSEARSLAYSDDEEPPGEDDGQGAWADF